MSFGLVLALAAMATTAAADTSLDNEVENYLEANAGQAAEPATFRMFWKDGIKGESGDGNFTFHLRGRMYFDMDWRDDDDDLDSDIRLNHTGFTNLRLGVEGTMYKNVLYKLEVNFADGDMDPDSSGAVVRLADVYIGLANFLKGALLIGYQRQSFSLEEMTSSRFQTFVAHAPSVVAFAPGRNSGMQWFGNFAKEEKLFLSLGIFNRTNNEGNVAGNGGWGFNTRIAFLAIENADKDMILEIGFNLLWQNLRKSGNMVSYGSRPALSMGPKAVDATLADISDEIRWGFELAFRMKKLHAQAEFFSATPNVDSGSDPTYTGWYFQIGYFITGESRAWDKKAMTWTRTVPKANFWTGEGGKGAWEVAFRYDLLDLTDVADDGKLTTMTFGVNWYWNPNARVMFNYVYADVEDGGAGETGALNAFVMRFQFDF